MIADPTDDPTELILLSGGLDSTVALANSGPNAVLAVSVDYGQRHVREIEAARAVAAFYRIPHLTLDLTGWGHLLTGSALTDSHVEVPEGHYEAPSMAATVVPNRNATFLMAAVGIAQSRGIDKVVTAVHAGDHAIYADCRPEFIHAANVTARLSTDHAVSISAPFLEMSKTEIVQLGEHLDAPLFLTWSCYKGGEAHCGVCGTCVERIEAFEEAGWMDPTVYLTDPTVAA